MSSVVISLCSSEDREQNFEHYFEESWEAERVFHPVVHEEKVDAFLCASHLFLVYRSVNDNEIFNYR